MNKKKQALMLDEFYNKMLGYKINQSKHNSTIVLKAYYVVENQI